MVERFLLYGIDVLADGASVNQGVERAVQIFAHMADTQFAIRYYAVMGAQVAAHTILSDLLVKRSLFHLFFHFLPNLNRIPVVIQPEMAAPARRKHLTKR